MTTTNFIDKETVIQADWANDVDETVYVTVPTNTADILTNTTNISNHIADTTDAHAGTAITNTPAGGIAATTVQAAINELDTEKLSTTTAASTYAPISGSYLNQFAVANGVFGYHAARLDQISLLPTVVSATATDIFGAAGATISIDNSTPVTTTSFTACTYVQVGSVKRVIPVENWSVTASANLVVDGATSGTFVMPAGAKLEVLASTTTKFELTTTFASGTWTPNQGAGLTVVGAFSSSGIWSKSGKDVTLHFLLAGSTTVACSSAGIMFTNMPFTVHASLAGHGVCTDAGDSVTAGIKAQQGTTSGYCCTAIGSSAQINGTVVYST